MHKDSRGAHDLHALCQIAGERARGVDGFARVVIEGDGSPTPAWARPRARKMLLAGVLGACTVAAIAAHVLQQPTPEPGPMPVAADESQAQAWLDAPTAASASEDPIRWKDQQLVVDIDGEPLGQAIEQLAAATNSTVTGQHVMDESGRVTMHWHAANASAAWQLLLQDRAAFSVRCESTSCQVRVVRALDPSKGDAATVATPAANRPAPADASSPDKDSQPDGAC